MNMRDILFEGGMHIQSSVLFVSTCLLANDTSISIVSQPYFPLDTKLL